jgi:hypothetical protein
MLTLLEITLSKKNILIMLMIKKIKKIIKKILLRFNIHINYISSRDDILRFIDLFKIKIPKNIELIRAGSNNDGGYVVPDILDEIKYCYSAGVGKNISFEKFLLKYDIKSYGADGTINSPPEKIKDYKFLKKNIGIINNNNSIRFEDWINLDSKNETSLIGQIDIEGGEYNLIIDTPLDTLKKFKILVIEFHYLSKINSKILYKYFFDSFTKILNIFEICHIHINNAESQVKIKGIKIPPLLEITFLRKDFYDQNQFENVIIPHKLDQNNIQNNKTENFDKYWKIK